MSKSPYDIFDDDDDDDDDEFLKGLDSISAKLAEQSAAAPSVLPSSAKTLTDDDAILARIAKSSAALTASLGATTDVDMEDEEDAPEEPPSSPLSSITASRTPSLSPMKLARGTRTLLSPPKRLTRGAASLSATPASTLNGTKKKGKPAATPGGKQISLMDFFSGPAKVGARKGGRGRKKKEKDPLDFGWKLDSKSEEFLNNLKELENFEAEETRRRESMLAKAEHLRALERTTFHALVLRLAANGYNGATVTRADNLAGPRLPRPKPNKKTSPLKSRGGNTKPKREDEDGDEEATAAADAIEDTFSISREAARIMHQEHYALGSSDYATCTDFYLFDPIFTPYTCERPTTAEFSKGADSGTASSHTTPSRGRPSSSNQKSGPWSFLAHLPNPHFIIESGKLSRHISQLEKAHSNTSKEEPFEASMPPSVWTWILFSFASSPQRYSEQVLDRYANILGATYSTQWDPVDMLRRVFTSAGLRTDTFDEICESVRGILQSAKEHIAETGQQEQGEKVKPSMLEPPSLFNLRQALKPVLGPRYYLPQTEVLKLAIDLSVRIVSKSAQAQHKDLELLQLLVFILYSLIASDASLLSQSLRLDIPAAISKILATVPECAWSNKVAYIHTSTHIHNHLHPGSLLFQAQVADKYRGSFAYKLVYTVCKFFSPEHVSLRARILDTLAVTSSCGRIMEVRRYLGTAFFTTSTFDEPASRLNSADENGIHPDKDEYAEPVDFFFDAEDINATVQRTVFPLLCRDPIFASARDFLREIVTRRETDPYHLQAMADKLRNAHENRRTSLLVSWRRDKDKIQKSAEDDGYDTDRDATMPVELCSGIALVEDESEESESNSDENQVDIVETTGLEETRARTVFLSSYALHHIVRIDSGICNALVSRLQDVRRTVRPLHRGPGKAGIKTDEDEDNDDDDRENDDDDKEENKSMLGTIGLQRSRESSVGEGDSETASPELDEEDGGSSNSGTPTPPVIVKSSSNNGSAENSVSPSPSPPPPSLQRPSPPAPAALWQREVRRKVLPAVTRHEVREIARLEPFTQDLLSLDSMLASILARLNLARLPEHWYTSHKVAAAKKSPLARPVVAAKRTSTVADEEATSPVNGTSGPLRKKMKTVSFVDDVKQHDGKKNMTDEEGDAEMSTVKEGEEDSTPREAPVSPVRSPSPLQQSRPPVAEPLSIPPNVPQISMVKTPLRPPIRRRPIRMPLVK